MEKYIHRTQCDEILEGPKIEKYLNDSNITRYMANKKRLRVADFFCGAGGFSEGFRQTGFEVVFALDNWEPAIKTHKLNHPDCKHVLIDVRRLDTPEMIDRIVPDVDVMIGSPPCVAFSGSNKAGKADKSPGIQLIESYLRIIAWKKKKGKLKYWLLENVPNSSGFIKEEYSFEELGLPGKDILSMKQRNIIDASDYGAPQGRKRFVCGDYPLPKCTHTKDEKITMRHVMDCLGNPQDIGRNNTIKDPNYDISIPTLKLTDHFYDSRIAEFEWKRAKRLKEDHGFMGKMSFPENLDRPSRTVMATMSASTRESMIFRSEDNEGKPNGYRLPTIREIASFMSFPITYQFEANNESSKYRLVGNAVCSKMAASISKEILKKENLDIPKKFIPLQDIPASYNLNGSRRKQKVKSPKRFDSKFSVHIPYLKEKSFRVELSNLESDFIKKSIRWTCTLHQGTGKKALKTVANQKEVIMLLNDYEQFPNFQKDVKEKMSKNGLTALGLQESYCNHNDSTHPYSYLEMIKEIVDDFFPEETYSGEIVDNSNRTIDLNKNYIPVRVLAGLFACNHFVSIIKDNNLL